MTYADIMISEFDLEISGIISKKENHTKPEIKANTEFKNEFEELIANIIRNQNNIQAKRIHRIICDECKTEEDQRLYDKENILIGEDQGVITWRDKYRNNRQRSYSQSSLANVISQVRIKLN